LSIFFNNISHDFNIKAEELDEAIEKMEEVQEKPLISLIFSNHSNVQESKTLLIWEF